MILTRMICQLSSSSSQSKSFNICCHRLLLLLNIHTSNYDDATAKRPNKVCDPYEQNGMPLSGEECQRLMNLNYYSTAAAAASSTNKNVVVQQWKLLDCNRNIICNNNNIIDTTRPPMYLIREFEHLDYRMGHKFVSSMASVAFMNNHFPKISLHRKLLKHPHRWQVVTTIECHTQLLKGLSYNDFQIAMYMDFEVERLRHLLVIPTP